MHQTLDHPGDTREHRAPQDQELPVDEVIAQLGDLDRNVERLGVQVFVDRRSDYHHHRVGLSQDGGIGCGLESAAAQDLLKDIARPRLVKGHSPSRHSGHGSLIDVVHGCPEAAAGKRERQWQPDMPATTYYRHIESGHSRLDVIGWSPANPVRSDSRAC